MMDEPSLRQRIAEAWSSLTREQKISAGILGVCGFTALILSAQRVNSNLVAPFTVSRRELQVAQQKINSVTEVLREDEIARRTDTDGDSLSDYDEEKAFLTSPYMRDTDGDGVPDNVELALGEDPNCATGQPCTTPKIDLSGLASSTPSLIGVPSSGSPDDLYAAFQRGMNQGGAKIQAESGSTSTLLQPQLVRDPKAIRKAIIETGKLSAKDLEVISDAQLLELYDQAVAESSKQAAAEAATNPNSPQAVLLQEAQSD